MVLADVLEQRYEEVFFDEFYRDIFQEGYLAEWSTDRPREDYPSGSTWYYTAIAMEQLPETWPAKDGKLPRHKTVRHAVYDDLAAIHELVENPVHTDHFIYMPPVSYVGYRRLNKNARQMFALCIEVDDLLIKGEQQEGLRFLFQMFKNGQDRKVILNAQMPTPTYILCSGSGLHLYYVFEKPINLYPSIFKQLGKLKNELTRRLWNEKVTTAYNNIQYEGICQPFRMLGTVTKAGEKTRAFKFGEKCDIEYLNSYVLEQYRVFLHYEKYQRAAGITPLPIAKEKWPDWYERVPVKQRLGEQPVRKSWQTNRAMYDKLLERIPHEARSGKRYNCLLILASAAIKCKISKEEFAADCWRLWPILDFDELKPFTKKDIQDVIQAYDSKELVRTTVEAAAALSGLTFTRSVRKGQKQEWHLEDIRTKKEQMKKRGQQFANPEGRPKGSGTAQAKVLEWRKNNPDGTKYRCIKDTGLDKKTVYKWWDTTIDSLPATENSDFDWLDDFEF